jgi:regulator of nonsense transcripts 2
LDERSQAIIKTAFFTVKPPANGPKKQAKVYPPLEGYLRHLLMVKMEPTESSIGFVSKQLIRCPWADPSKQCGQLICKIMLKTCRKGRYKAIHAIAAVAAKLRRHKPEVCIRLIDAALEELEWSLEHPAFKDQQRTITYARLLGELYCSSLASGQLVIQQLYTFIDFGHEIPEALRQASEKQQSMSTNGGAAEGEQLNVPRSATGISQTIQEDEEMDESELAIKEDTAPAEPVPVAVSRYSKHDPRVPSFFDPPNSVFRIKLVCTLLEVVGKTIVTRNNFPKIEGFLAAFQRYLFTKTMLPAEVEFALLDTFDIIDSQWKKVTKDVGKSKKYDGTASQSQGFPRYPSWLEAHNSTVAVEEAEAIIDNKARARLEHVARDTKSDCDDTVGSDLVHDEDDDDMMEDDDDSTEDALSVSAKDSLADDHSDQLSGDEGGEDGMEVDEESQSGDEDEEDDSDDDDEDDSDDDEGSEEEFDEQAYMQQLEDEAFERELRRLTMDALDKGKAIARGGKVSEHMPTGSQFIKKKSTETTAEGPTMALGGKEGISFQLLKKGNKGKLEAKQFVVPTDTNLALVATKQDDEAARERDMIKARVLQYEAASAEAGPGGNVYLEQEKLQSIRNRPLSMDEIDRNFGTTGGSLRMNDKPKSGPAGRGGPSGTDSFGGRGRGGSFGGRGPGSGRGSGRGRGGRGSSSGRSLV